MDEIIYKVQAPDGSILRIAGPSGASEADLQGAAQQHYDALQKNSWTSAEKIPPMPTPKPQGFANQVVENLPKELFEKSRPTAQLAIGALKPFAGLAEYGGITAPAEVLNRLSQRFEEGSSPTTAKVLDIAGQVLPVSAGAKAISQMPQLGQYLPKAVDAIKKVVQSSPVLNYGLQGAGQAALTPVSTPENAGQSYKQMLENKMENIGMGAGVGALFGKGSQMLMNPAVTQKMQMLKDMGGPWFSMDKSSRPCA